MHNTLNFGPPVNILRLESNIFAAKEIPVLRYFSIGIVRFRYEKPDGSLNVVFLNFLIYLGLNGLVDLSRFFSFSDSLGKFRSFSDLFNLSDFFGFSKIVVLIFLIVTIIDWNRKKSIQ
jgi:hypothetical protein